MSAASTKRALALRFDAFDVGLAARDGRLSPARVLVLEARARAALADPFSGVVLLFAQRARRARRDIEAVAEAGRALLQAIDVDLMPVPPGAERKDLNG